MAKPTNTLHNGPGRLSKDAAIRSRLAIFAGLLASIAIPRAIAAQETQQFVSGEVDFGQLDEDAYVTPRVDYGLRVWKDDPRCVDPACDVAFDMLLSAPVRLRVIDAQPADAGVLREEDWDEPSDYARIVRHVEYGNPNGPLHARLGELGPLVIGHGSIMNSYFNVVTPDVYEAGLHLNANTRYGGLQLMLDDVLQPTVFGIRGYVRPWGQAAANPWTRLSIGVSAVSDFRAPTALQTRRDGTVAVDPRNYPRVAASEPVTIAGADVGFLLVDADVFDLLPYVDFAVGGGPGLHAGAAFRVRPTDGLTFSARGEFRWIGPGYLPDYFGPLYEIDRYQYAGWGSGLPAPKARVAASREDAALGGFGSLTANAFGLVSLSASVADAQGPRNTSAWLRLTLTPPKLPFLSVPYPLDLGLVYYKQSFDGIDALADPDGALIVGEARVTVWGPVYVRGSYDRLWRLHNDGVYDTIDTWNAGAGIQWSW